jgi:putative colanic acid biosysnthesis UDP-glucose lipid carrier transferase
MVFNNSQYTTRYSRYIKVLLICFDILLLNLAFIGSVYFRFENFDLLFKQEIRTAWLMCNVLWFVIIMYYSAYKLDRIEHIDVQIKRIITHTAIHFASIAIISIFLKFNDISRLSLLYFYLLFTFLIVFFRIIAVQVLKNLRLKGFNYRNVIIIGANETGERIRKILSNDLSYGFRVLGTFDDKNELNSDSKLNLLGSINDVESFISNTQVHEIYVALKHDCVDSINQIIKLREKHIVRIKFIPDFHVYTKTRRVQISFYENLPVLMLRAEPLEIPLNRIVKKSFDFLFALFVILFVISWLFPILMILVKLSSPGPVFYKQTRSGENNVYFTCFKFRSMRIHNEEFIQATANDPRITKIGAILRKTNLDEFPQFFNVLLGQMSIVGPRPHPIALDQQYNELINNYLIRHYAKPGITGWAQVNGYRGETRTVEDMKKRVLYDIWYIENWSFLLDLKIIWLTVWNMVRGEKNAY